MVDPCSEGSNVLDRRQLYDREISPRSYRPPLSISVTIEVSPRIERCCELARRGEGREAGCAAKSRLIPRISSLDGRDGSYRLEERVRVERIGGKEENGRERMVGLAMPDACTLDYVTSVKCYYHC